MALPVQTGLVGGVLSLLRTSVARRPISRE